VTPIVFLVMIVVLLVLLAANNPAQAFLGVVVVSLGLPVYLFLYRNKRLEERRTTQ
jgi:multisubunit Na+/H+ antiporter MnhB subunit